MQVLYHATRRYVIHDREDPRCATGGKLDLRDHRVVVEASAGRLLEDVGAFERPVATVRGPHEAELGEGAREPLGHLHRRQRA
jgi:hypothetical protein